MPLCLLMPISAYMAVIKMPKKEAVMRHKYGSSQIIKTRWIEICQREDLRALRQRITAVKFMSFFDTPVVLP